MMPLSATVFLLFFVSSQSLVIELSEKFGEHWKSGTWLVKFYAPWCGYCKSFAPVWEDIGRILHLKDPTIHVGRLDCTQHKEAASQFDIRGMPTVKLFHKGNEYVYEGRRETSHVVKFVERATGPAVVPLKGKSDLERAVKKSKVIFVLLNGNEYALEVFQEVAQTHIMTAWCYSLQSKDIQEEHGLDEKPHLLVFKDGNSYVYDDLRGIDLAAMSEWIKQEQLPAFPDIELFEIQDYVISSKLIVTFALGNSQKEYPFIPESQKAVEAVAVSRAFHPDFYFILMESDEVVRRETMEQISAPCLVVFNFSSNEFYPLENDFSVKAVDQNQVTSFLTKIKSRSIEPKGGQSYYQSFCRFLWALKDMVKGMWRTQPVIVAVLGSLVILLFLVLLFVACSSAEDDDHHGAVSIPQMSEEQDQDSQASANKTEKKKLD